MYLYEHKYSVKLLLLPAWNVLLEAVMKNCEKKTCLNI